jgi:N-acetyl-1-D-myo-inositol-2-amino-2-deoxy-alpha-D-glucopyranoside deacetylase
MVHVLDHPDGDLRGACAPRLQADILRTIRQLHPEAVITFDDDGLYWHPDHVSVHEQTSRAVFSLGRDAPSLYYVTMAHGLMCRIFERAAERSWVPPPAGVWSIAPASFGLAAPAPTFAVDVRPWVTRKLAALQSHRTQVGAVNPFSLLDPGEASEWLGFEYFRRAPISGRNDRVLEDIADRSLAREAMSSAN